MVSCKYSRYLILYQPPFAKFCAEAGNIISVTPIRSLSFRKCKVSGSLVTNRERVLDGLDLTLATSVMYMATVD